MVSWCSEPKDGGHKETTQGCNIFFLSVSSFKNNADANL